MKGPLISCGLLSLKRSDTMDIQKEALELW
jgi:hypothetical protein